MQPDAWDDLSALVQRGDEEAVVRAVRDLDEPARRTVAKRAASLWRQIDREEWDAREPNWRDRAQAAQALVFATGGSAAAARLWWYRWHENRALVLDLIRTRPREWRQDFAERVFADDEVGEPVWPTVHALVEDGAIDPPESDGYPRHAVTGLRDYEARDGGRAVLRRKLADVLRDEPRFREHELWRLLALENSGLTARNGWYWADDDDQTWTEALVELAGDGTLDRQRLLDASLAALRSDWSAYNARWHHQFHEALEPTVEEHVARLPELLALLAATDAAVVAFALRALGRLEKAGQLETTAFLEAVPPALTHPTKGHATRAVKLTGRLLKRSPDAAPLVLPTLVDALAHEAREVQEAVLAVLERHEAALTGEDRARVTELAALADPAVRARVAAPAPEVDRVEVPPVRTVSRLAPRLQDAEPLAPVRDMDDLLERAAVAIERGDDPDELELLLDGVSRLRRQPVDPGRRKALLDRAGQHTFAWEGRVTLNRAVNALGATLIAWLEPGTKDRVWAGGTAAGDAIAQRVRDLIGDLDGPPRALLAAPTHRGGWIDPQEAVRRVAALDGRPLVTDLAQMVMRLAPDGRDDARRAAEALPGEAAGVLSRALGGDARRPMLAKLKVAWAAADDARDPEGHALPVEPAPPAAGWRPDDSSKQATEPPAALLMVEDLSWAWDETGLERWLATVWPANQELVFRFASRRLWLGGAGRPHVGDILELLLHPAEPVGPHAATALALALGTEAVEERALGVDVAVAVLETRRLGGAGLGERMGWVLREQPDVVPSRWGPSLTDVATAGPLHAHEVQAAIESVLAAAGDGDRRRLLPVVELLRRLAVEAARPVADPAARAWLAGISGSSKIARAAREALAVT